MACLNATALCMAMTSGEMSSVRNRRFGLVLLALVRTKTRRDFGDLPRRWVETLKGLKTP
jgi:hypothetical protein